MLLLFEQVTDMLEKHDMFLKRIEPEIEGITGEERDTASFMKMMRLFNEVKTYMKWLMEGKGFSVFFFIFGNLDSALGE